MRTVYTGLYYTSATQVQSITERVARMTHAGKRSTEACKIYARMINLLTASESQEQDAQRPHEFLERHCRAVPEYLDAAHADTVEPAAGGYVVDSMRIAVGSLATSHTFKEAVAVNLGGDADTNGAITGGLAGAWYGYDAIPEEWIAALSPEVRARLDRLAGEAIKARRGKLCHTAGQ